MRDARGDGINTTFEIFTMGQLLGEPVFVDKAAPGLDRGDNLAHQLGMFIGRDVAIVGNLTRLPGAFNLVAGVIAGVIATVIVFISKSSKAGVRSVQRGDSWAQTAHVQNNRWPPSACFFWRCSSSVDSPRRG